MKPEQRTRLWLSAQNWIYVLLVLLIVGLAAWLSTRYTFEADWTANNRNSLAAPSVKLLHKLDGPITITAYARDGQGLRDSIREFVARYQREKSDIKLDFVNPDTSPQEVRDLGITTDGTMMVSYAGGQEKVARQDEQTMTNALARLARKGERKVVFVTGHGERSPTGQANFDLGKFGRALKQRGVKLDTVNLASHPSIPRDTQLLVVAGPQVDFLPGEAAIVKDWVARGGNLWWLTEPGGLHGLKSVGDELGVSQLPGVVVDPTSRLFGIQDPAYALVVQYPRDFPMTRDLSELTLFPQAAAITAPVGRDWKATPFLRTVDRTWTETGDLQNPKGGTISYDAGTAERAGPLTIGLALTRKVDETEQTAKTKDEKGAGVPDGAESQKGSGEAGKKDGDDSQKPTPKTQRVVVTGDGDFLSNSFLGNGANLDLGQRMVDWLLGDEKLIEIAPSLAPDTGLELGQFASAAISLGALFVLPGLLVLAGLLIWLRRRRR